MSSILSNGYKLPEVGDFGSSFFPDLEFNIQRLNDHSHDGNDGNRLNASSIVAQTSIISSGDFTNISPGVNRALITLPATMAVDTTSIQVRDLVTKEQVFLKIEKFSATQVYVFSNLITDYEAMFTS